uniref:Uncharacterized protein n=1 Tax=Bactrocera latifrons TaxID=174628 RepID=A0A0K8V6U6_BACLA
MFKILVQSLAKNSCESRAPSQIAAVTCVKNSLILPAAKNHTIATSTIARRHFLFLTNRKPVSFAFLHQDLTAGSRKDVFAEYKQIKKKFLANSSGIANSGSFYRYFHKSSENLVEGEASPAEKQKFSVKSNNKHSFTNSSLYIDPDEM